MWFVVFPSPYPGQVAGVAFHSIPVATTAQLVHGLGSWEFALESVAARICREAGGRVTTNVMVRGLDLAAPNMFDARRLEGGRPPSLRWCAAGCGHHSTMAKHGRAFGVATPVDAHVGGFMCAGFVERY